MKGDFAKLVQAKGKIHIENPWNRGSDMFFMELVLTDTKLLVLVEVKRNPIFLISKVLDIFEDFTAREGAKVLWAHAVV